MIDTRKAMNRVWGLAAALALVDALGLCLTGLRLDPVALLKTLAIGAVPLALSWFYTSKRPEPMLAALLESAAFLVLFTLALAISSYIGTSLGLPLQDGLFDRLDKAMGFDFLDHLAFVAARPDFAALLDYAYMSSMMQVVVVVLALAFVGEIARLRAYMALFALTATATIFIATLCPTIGTYAFYDVADAMLPAFRDPRAGWDQVKHILALRDGSMREIPLNDIRGLVSFPSFHTALAVVTTWAVLRVRYLNVAVAALNFPLLLATPTNGSHYLCDIIVGAGVAFAALRLVSGYERRAPEATRRWAAA